MPYLGTLLEQSSVGIKRTAWYGLITSLATVSLFSTSPVSGQPNQPPTEEHITLGELFRSVEQEGVDSISAPKQLDTSDQEIATQAEKPALNEATKTNSESVNNTASTTINPTPKFTTKDTTKSVNKSQRNLPGVTAKSGETQATVPPTKQEIASFRLKPISKPRKQAPPIRLIRLSDQNTQALAAALTNREIATAQILLQNGADLSAVNDKGQTLLMMAAVNTDAGLVRTMIQQGAKINARDNWGWTALFHATIKGQLDIVNVLLEAGADPNLIGYDGRSAVMAASWNRYHEILSLLVKSGANVNIKNRDGWTALSFAAWNGDETAVRILLNATADKSIRTNEGESALALAEQAGYIEIANLLR